jgi:hypothetical protein
MSEPRLSKQAEADLDELWLYIAGNNPDAADRMVDAVLWMAAGCMSAFQGWAKTAFTPRQSAVPSRARRTSWSP